METQWNRTSLAGALAVGAMLLAVQWTSLARAAASASDAGTQLGEQTRNEVLDELARQLELQYAIPDMANRLAQAVRAKRKSNAYKRIVSAPELARSLKNDLYAIAHDKHLRVIFSFSPVPQRPDGPTSADELEHVRKLNGMIPKVEILDGNVGYMRVNGVPALEAARDSVVAAFAFLHRTDALIIDNRGNGGGDPNTVALYMSYLSEGDPYVVNTFHWRKDSRIEEFRTTDLGELSYGARKPVFALTSPGTFSGGEELTYDLKVSKRAVVIGEVTGGGANPGGPVPLGHQFVVNIPSGQPVNPITGTNWEGVGVTPDVAVPAALALSKAHSLVIERLTAEASDPERRSMLEAVAMKLDSIAEADSASATRLANAQVVGIYAPRDGSGADVTIVEKDGRLMQDIDGSRDAALVPVKGNRYAREGSPEGFITSFLAKNDKTYLLLEVPFGPPAIREKR
jgi:retinol-binding protein 3